MTLGQVTLGQGTHCQALSVELGGLDSECVLDELTGTNAEEQNRGYVTPRLHPP